MNTPAQRPDRFHRAVNVKRRPFLLIGAGVVALIFGLVWSHHRLGKRSLAVSARVAATESFLSRSTVLAPTDSPSAGARPSELRATGLPESFRVLLRSKLKQFSQTQTGDEASQSQLTQELLALLTDANAGDLVLSLSAEDLSTPFGLAALDRWLAVDTVEALSWIGARSDVSKAETFVVARKLLNDPELLANFCSRLPNTEWKQQFLSTASLEALPKSTALALSFAQQMAPGEAQTNVWETVVYDWTGHDPAAVAQWLAEVTDPGLQEKLFAVAAKAIAVTDPDLAAGWIAKAVKSDGVLADSALCVVDTWVSRDPLKASNWIAQLPVGHARTTAIDLVLNQWLKTDAPAANAWIQRLPERESVLAGLKAAEEQRRAPLSE